MMEPGMDRLRLRIAWVILISLAAAAALSPGTSGAATSALGESDKPAPVLSVEPFRGIRIVGLGPNPPVPQMVQEVEFSGSIERVTIRGRGPDDLSEVFVRVGESTWHVVPGLKRAVQVYGDYAVDPSVLTISFLQAAASPDSGASWQLVGVDRLMGREVVVWDLAGTGVRNGHFRIWMDGHSGIPIRVERRHHRGDVLWSTAYIQLDSCPVCTDLVDIVTPDTVVYPNLFEFRRAVLLASVEQQMGVTALLDRVPDTYDVAGVSTKRIGGLVVVHMVFSSTEINRGKDISVFLYRAGMGASRAEEREAVQKTLSTIRRRFGRDLRVVSEERDALVLTAVGEADPTVLSGFLKAIGRSHEACSDNESANE